jgi:hypothetical protein
MNKLFLAIGLAALITGCTTTNPAGPKADFYAASITYEVSSLNTETDIDVSDVVTLNYTEEDGEVVFIRDVQLPWTMVLQVSKKDERGYIMTVRGKGTFRLVMKENDFVLIDKSGSESVSGYYWNDFKENN